jgi:YD repeat-containing protein
MRRLFKALTVGCAVVAVLVLILVPILPYSVPNYGPCCSGVDGQSIAFKYLGYGFLSSWTSPSGDITSTSHYYEWCQNTGTGNGYGFSCRTGFSLW